jgi:tetratricopeptide (TPR) repeat protein
MSQTAQLDVDPPAPGFLARIWIWITGGEARRQYLHAVQLLSSPQIVDAEPRILLRIADICAGAGDGPRATAAYWSAGRMLQTRGRSQHALSPLRRVVQLAPTEVLARLELGSCYENLERRREAAFEYDAAAALLEPTVPYEALALLSRAVGLDPAHRGAWQRLMELRRRLGEPVEAPVAAVPTSHPRVVEAAPRVVRGTAPEAPSRSGAMDRPTPVSRPIARIEVTPKPVVVVAQPDDDGLSTVYDPGASERMAALDRALAEQRRSLETEVLIARAAEADEDAATSLDLASPLNPRGLPHTDGDATMEYSALDVERASREGEISLTLDRPKS